MNKITYCAKFYIVDSVLSVFGLIFSTIAFFYFDSSVHWLIFVLYCYFAVIALFLSIELLKNIQWINIDENNFCAYNIFGMIKNIEIAKIQAIKVVSAPAWSVKMYSKYYSCVVISTRKKINRRDIEDAYNHKKSYYIIFPNTYSNVQKLKVAYERATGTELEIA